MLRTIFALFLIAMSSLFSEDNLASAAELQEAVAQFADAKSFSDVEAVIDRMGETGDPAAAPILRALSEGKLQTSAKTKMVAIRKLGNLFEALTGKTITEGADNFKKVRVKNSLRRKIAAVLSGLTLKAPSAASRLRAAETIFQSADASAIEALDDALKTETNETVRAAFRDARASAVLASGAADADKSEAVAALSARGDQKALALLSGALPMANVALKPEIEMAIGKIKANLAVWTHGQNIWYGISLGSVLLLAAIGLAITFGVMGVINMAHGEMVMLGAYTTFAVQQFINATAPHLFGWSLLFALPLAFLVSGTVGLVMERGLIRFLYGRPLETLLATWGVSLILQQTVRSIFGPTNREVGNPDWMSGAFQLGQLSITWNRLWIVVFAAFVFAALYFIINRTSFGLNMRAVTQNRQMAGAMGIRTSWVDAFTFALGSGIAGIAGVALSQIGNVSPNLGQSYIIDSFLVVVFGGVGNLWGTLVGAVGLGIANKFLEPFAGAVLGKVIVLIAIILFIQKRPRGLFALKGRAIET